MPPLPQTFPISLSSKLALPPHCTPSTPAPILSLQTVPSFLSSNYPIFPTPAPSCYPSVRPLSHSATLQPFLCPSRLPDSPSIPPHPSPSHRLALPLHQPSSCLPSGPARPLSPFPRRIVPPTPASQSALLPIVPAPAVPSHSVFLTEPPAPLSLKEILTPARSLPLSPGRCHRRAQPASARRRLHLHSPRTLRSRPFIARPAPLPPTLKRSQSPPPTLPPTQQTGPFP